MADPRGAEIAKLEALFSENPDGRVFTHLAEAYRRAGEPERARVLLETGLARHADYASAHVVHGRVLLDLGLEAEAEAAFRRVLRLDPENLVALRALGDLARRAGRPQDALGFYEQLRARDPSSAELDAIIRELEAAAPGPESYAYDAPAAGALDSSAEVGGQEAAEAEAFGGDEAARDAAGAPEAEAGIAEVDRTDAPAAVAAEAEDRGPAADAPSEAPAAMAEQMAAEHAAEEPAGGGEAASALDAAEAPAEEWTDTPVQAAGPAPEEVAMDAGAGGDEGTVAASYEPPAPVEEPEPELEVGDVSSIGALAEGAAAEALPDEPFVDEGLDIEIGELTSVPGSSHSLFFEEDYADPEAGDIPLEAWAPLTETAESGEPGAASEPVGPTAGEALDVDVVGEAATDADMGGAAADGDAVAEEAGAFEAADFAGGSPAEAVLETDASVDRPEPETGSPAAEAAQPMEATADAAGDVAALEASADDAAADAGVGPAATLEEAAHEAEVVDVGPDEPLEAPTEPAADAFAAEAADAFAAEAAAPGAFGEAAAADAFEDAAVVDAPGDAGSADAPAEAEPEPVETAASAEVAEPEATAGDVRAEDVRVSDARAEDARAAGEAAAEPAAAAGSAPSPFAASEGAEPLGGEVVTETLADLYLAQGLYERAAALYRQLLETRPGDERLESRLARAEAGLADAERAGEGGAGWEVVEAAAGEAAPTTSERLEDVEAVWTGGAGTDAGGVSPYAWPEDGETEEGDAGGGVTIGQYLEGLLAWKPSAPAASGPEAPAGAAAMPQPDVQTEDAGGGVGPGREPGTGTPVEGGEPAKDDDDDLEMFRAWLQSLKR